ncbi:MAG: biotin carboxylase N-terminal domain-containing protein, partial [Nitrospirales bacterium]
MFKKVLVANRGEIAMRVIRACREFGIATAAIYSESDATAIYVKKANEAYLVGPGPVQGYLDARQIVGLAKRIRADAIHPGYGFLAENADFARLCEEAGILFIGPSPHSLDLLGDKVKARELAIKIGVPVVPGTDGSVGTLEEALTFSQPFGNGDLFLEKYVERPHHIEFQLLADKNGYVIHLGERDCSIQRRHQKLLEIAPSLVLTPRLRAEMGEAAIAMARAAQFYNAGTVEFLLDPDGRYYFMEMNPRIQVEHTVTEQITTVDIVQSQLWIAAGRPLVFGQHEVNLQGYAIQCRINAEDPQNGFRPSSGKITAYLSPGGVGVRIDGAVYKDYTVPPYYDALLAKLTVHGRTWDETVRRTHRSLEEFVLRGVKTTIPFMGKIMEEPDFRAGRFDTSYLERHPALFEYEEAEEPEDLVVALSAAVAAFE